MDEGLSGLIIPISWGGGASIAAEQNPLEGAVGEVAIRVGDPDDTGRIGVGTEVRCIDRGEVGDELEVGSAIRHSCLKEGGRIANAVCVAFAWHPGHALEASANSWSDVDGATIVRPTGEGRLQRGHSDSAFPPVA